MGQRAVASVLCGETTPGLPGITRVMPGGGGDLVGRSILALAGLRHRNTPVGIVQHEAAAPEQRRPHHPVRVAAQLQVVRVAVEVAEGQHPVKAEGGSGPPSRRAMPTELHTMSCAVTRDTVTCYGQSCLHHRCPPTPNESFPLAAAWQVSNQKPEESFPERLSKRQPPLWSMGPSRKGLSSHVSTALGKPNSSCHPWETGPPDNSKIISLANSKTNPTTGKNDGGS